MVEISHRERIVRAKIIYYGPAAGGKTTNLVVLHRRADDGRRGEMVSVNSTQDRTILLDLLPVKTPAFRGYELRFQVIAVPGQRMYAASRKLLLNGADAVVFVANSAADRWEETIQSLREMNQNLLAHGLDPTNLPATIQYNKRDLPEVTPLDAMERTLNARRSASFPAVAIREDGVLETFASALRTTMEDITERYKLGAQMRSSRSIEEWVNDSMRAMFGWGPAASNQAETQADADVAVPAAAGATAAGRPEQGEATTAAVSTAATVAPLPSATAADSRTMVKVPVSRAVEGTSGPSAATDANDPQAAESLVESYAQAAANLATALEEMRDERDIAAKRLAELSAPVEAARALLMGTPPAQVLQNLVLSLGRGLGARASSLSLFRPDGRLQPVILNQLTAEPLFTLTDDAGRALAAVVLQGGEPVVHVSGDSGPFGKALERPDHPFTSLIAIPVKTPSRDLGLLTFYLPPETPAPRSEAVAHFERLGHSLALALELAAGRIADERLLRTERVAIVGRLAEQAVMELGRPMDQLFAATGRLRARPDAPDWLGTELRALGMELTRAKRYRDGVLSFMAGQLPSAELIRLGAIFEKVRALCSDNLERNGVQLDMAPLPEEAQVRADAFLLRCAISALVEKAEQELSGHEGARIRVAAHFDNGKALIQVNDNAAVTRTDGSGAPPYVSWPIDRKVKGWPLSFVASVVEYCQGEWKASTTDQGTQITLILPAV